ncbi:hypothetical protein I600_1828 [Maribacter dokdonensis DSW-8]|nr:hypothetical protein I600_1828 [Maribacter dokdonensis DSW-8]
MQLFYQNNGKGNRMGTMIVQLWLIVFILVFGNKNFMNSFKYE